MNQAVLIVDDSLTVRMDLAEAFQEAGFLALPCSTVAEARAALSTRDGLSTPAQIEIWPDWAPRAFRLQVFQVRTE